MAGEQENSPVLGLNYRGLFSLLECMLENQAICVIENYVSITQ